MRRVLISVLALALLAAACGDDSSGNGIEEERPVEVTGAFLPLLPDGGADPAVGSPMPELEGASFDATPVSITNDGRPKVLIFLAHW